MRILITGIAGFIGFHVARALIGKCHEVFGIDNLNPYYDVNLKKARLAQLPEATVATFDIMNTNRLAGAFDDWKPEVVIHLAAQAGVRHSIDKPRDYLNANIIGTFNILECCAGYAVDHLMLASTSSVYGNNRELLSEYSNTDRPESFYAATKKATEIMAHSYSSIHNVPTTVMRFFTVYGPWGRPDMALFKFTKAILENQPIELFNHGDMIRDFTYIDDLVHQVAALAHLPWPNDYASTDYRTLNIGGGSPERLMDFLLILQEALGKEALCILKPMQQGDVQRTESSNDAIRSLIGFSSQTTIRTGIPRFVEWYKSYYKVP